jgi:hypothetical protein
MPSSGHNDIEDCAGLTARDQGSRGDRRHGLPLRGNEFPGTGASGRPRLGQAGASSGQGFGPWGQRAGDRWRICVMAPCFSSFGRSGSPSSSTVIQRMRDCCDSGSCQLISPETLIPPTRIQPCSPFCTAARAAWARATTTSILWLDFSLAMRQPRAFSTAIDRQTTRYMMRRDGNAARAGTTALRLRPL